MFKIHIRIVFLTLFALVAFVSEAQNNTSLYLMNAQNGRVFDISALNGSLPTQTTTLSSEARSNLAVGPVPSNGSQSVFTSSNTLVNSTVYVANSSISTNLPAGLGGLTTNPNAGATFGHVYGISANRDLIKASPAPATNLGSISGDANWTNGTINGDGFFDNAGNLYTVAIVGTNKYLYKINISTRVATLVIQLSGALPENFQGLSFFNGRIYAVEGFISRLLLVVSSTFNARIYEINPNTGVGIVKTSYALNTQLLINQGTDDLDLASGQLYVPSEAPTCNELFGIVRGTQEVYRINLNDLSTTLVANGDQTTHGNVAYGPLPTDLSSNQFVTSINQNNGPIFSGLGSSSVTNLQTTSLQWNGSSGTNLAPVGIGTDPSTGVVWGIYEKRLSKWTGSGNAQNLTNITGDATWDSAVVLNDIAVDNGGNLYCIINVGTTNSWLYRVNPTTSPPTASPVVKLNGTYASTGGVNGNGLAYLNGFFYYSRLNGTADTDIWRVNALTGATTYVGLIDGSGTATASTNRGFGDLASCATVTNVPASFGFNCNSSEGGLQNNQFIKNGNVQADVLRIPISSAINGIAAVNISGAGLSTNPSPYSIFVQQGATFIDVPVSYNGTSDAGTVSVSVTSAAATGSCNIPVTILAASTDLQVTQTSSVSAAIFGTTVSFTITVKNNGPIPSLTTSLTDTWPAGITFVSATPSKGTVDTSTAVWTIGELQVGEEATLILTGTISATSTNIATITGNYSDPNTNNNTSSATINLTVTLDAVADNLTATGVQSISGVASVGNVLTNDTFNGGAAGSATVDNVAISVTTAATSINGGPVPTLNTATGVVSIPAGTPAGTYSITYQLCEKVSGTPCDSATTQITVASPAISASSETLSTTADGGTTTSVLANDSYNGGASGSATSSNVTASQEGTWPAGVTLNADGTITVAAGTPAGSYSLDYQICDKLNPTNCTTSTTTLNVTPTVNAVADNLTATGAQSISGVASVGNVLTNDTFNGGAAGSATVDNVAISVTTAATSINGGPVPTLNTATGVVSIPAGTPAGTYSITYQLCEKVSGTPCDSATTQITVASPAISASSETLSTTADGGTTTSVLANDSYNGGASGSATSSNVTASQEGTWPAGVTLNADGTITVAAGTPAGSYPVSYKICDKLNPTNCTTSTTTLNVTPTVNALADNLTATGVQSISGVASVGNVLTNDTFNGGAAGSATVDNVAISVTTAATSINDGPVPTLNTATGVVSIPAGTPAGTYSITYQLCEKVSGTPCDSATIEVIVARPSIVAVTETSTITANGGTIPTLLTNDTFNGENATTSNVTITTGGTTWPTGTTLNNDGTVTVAAGTPVGSNTVSYQICDILNPSNCATVSTIIVVSTAVNAAIDTFNATGNEAIVGVTSVGNVLANDTFNGAAAGSATASNVVVSVTTAATSINGGPVPTLNIVTGVVSVPTGTPAGLYTITYQICDLETGLVCSSTTVGIQISAATICYLPGIADANAGSTLDTSVGISSLDRAGAVSAWPQARKSGWIALEAKTKGFVVNRVRFVDGLPINGNGDPAITTPVEGMMVYDTVADCLKLYTTQDNGVTFAWYCLGTQTCPE